MNAIKLTAFAFIVIGLLVLAYGGYSLTYRTQNAKMGPLEVSVKQIKTVNIPAWAGIGTIIVGGVLLAMGSKKT